MSKTTLMRFSLLVLFCVALVSSHSQMRCAKYNKATGACSAPIRDQGYSFMRESNLYTNGAPICQSPFVNPISSYYANGAGCPDWAPCPAGMGSFTPGESFTIMWFARNHAVADQSPATVSLYMSPAGTSADPSADTMKKTLVCSGPYMNCNGKSGNEDPCTLDCKMPTTLASGTYSLWWKWDWQGVMYTTCADVKVTGGSSTPTPSTPTPTPTTPTPTPTPTTPTPTPTTPTPTPTTPTPTTPTKPSSTTLSPNNGNLCYLPNTPFLNAKLGKSGRCGSSSKTRCPDGSCCSKHGYCGTTADYCTNNQGDYRKYACSTVGDKGVVANQVYEGEEEQFLDNSSNSMTVNFVLIVCSMLLYVTMF